MVNNNRATIQDVYVIVNRLEDKLDKRLCDLDHRVDRLENFQSYIVGVAGVIGAIAGGAISVTWQKIIGKQ